MLTSGEKDALYKIISAVMGDDPSIRTRKAQFNLRTVAVVEDMVAANESCNSNMKELITDLIGGYATLSRGWLRRLLKTSKEKVNAIDMHGYGCNVVTKSRWRSAIIISVI